MPTGRRLNWQNVIRSRRRSAVFEFVCFIVKFIGLDRSKPPPMLASYGAKFITLAILHYQLRFNSD